MCDCVIFKDYIGEILTYWDITDREYDGISDVISLGLEDASAKAREFARTAYLQLRVKNLKRADRLKAHLQVPVRNKLVKVEEEYDLEEKRKKLHAQSFTDLDETISDVLLGNEESGSSVNTSNLLSGVVSLQALVRGSITRRSFADQNLEPSLPKAPTTSSVSGLFRKVAVENEHAGVHVNVAPPVHKNIVPPVVPGLQSDTKPPAQR